VIQEPALTAFLGLLGDAVALGYGQTYPPGAGRLLRV